MLELNINVADVDYSAVIGTMLPVIIEKMLHSENAELAQKFLGKISGMATVSAKAAISVFPQELKDEIAAICIENFKEQIAQTIVSKLAEMDIGILIKDMNVKVVEEN